MPALGGGLLKGCSYKAAGPTVFCSVLWHILGSCECLFIGSIHLEVTMFKTVKLKLHNIITNKRV